MMLRPGKRTQSTQQRSHREPAAVCWSRLDKSKGIPNRFSNHAVSSGARIEIAVCVHRRSDRPRPEAAL